MRSVTLPYCCETAFVEDEELVADQVAYYRARAPIYDEWWQRCGAYGKGPEMEAEWDRQLDQVKEAFRAFSPII